MSAQNVLVEYEKLSNDERQAVVEKIGAGLPSPPRDVLGLVWVILLLILAVVVIGGGFLVFRLIEDGKESAVIVGFVSGALGALIGLLAPSPAARV